MIKILKKIPGVSIIADSISSFIVVMKYTMGINTSIEDERADPDDPKWDDNPWKKVFEQRLSLIHI